MKPLATAMYSELVYFEGAHFAHIAAYAETNRLIAIRDRLSLFDRGVDKLGQNRMFLPTYA
jgi:hypothetical protein